MVLEFHQAFDLPVADQPSTEVPGQLIELRNDLLAEELEELARALDAGDIVGVADALADAVYVLYGTAWTFGIDLDKVFAEVHRANMSKLGPAGRPFVRSDGKVLKGPDYEAPDLRSVLRLDVKTRRTRLSAGGREQFGEQFAATRPVTGGTERHQVDERRSDPQEKALAGALPAD